MLVFHSRHSIRIMNVALVLTSLILTVGGRCGAEQRINGENGWFVPTASGGFVWLDSRAAAAQLAQLESRASSAEVSFYLFTNANPTIGQLLTYAEPSIANSHFNAANPTKFVIHGWKGSHADYMNRQITQAWLAKGDFNIIVVGWAGARTPNYVSAASAVGSAGSKVGQMIEHLHAGFAMPLNNLDVIGHSLGAHVAGYAGKAVVSEQLHMIMGLDPALPLFSWDKPAKRLASTDAHYVESIQTNGGKLGFLKPIGKGAFYPNGGRWQPGCGDDLDGMCSHVRSVTYYVEAVQRDNFGSIKCQNYEHAVAKSCTATFIYVRMGAITNAYMVSGTYYVPLNDESPFGVLH